MALKLVDLNSRQEIRLPEGDPSPTVFVVRPMRAGEKHHLEQITAALSDSLDVGGDYVAALQRLTYQILNYALVEIHHDGAKYVGPWDVDHAFFSAWHPKLTLHLAQDLILPLNGLTDAEKKILPAPTDGSTVPTLGTVGPPSVEPTPGSSPGGASSP